MTLHFSVRGVNYRRPGIALFCLLAPLSLHTNVAAQDVAEAAREQQAKKSQKPASHHHVYTEEDLKHARILTPEDQKQVAARKQNASAATSEQAAAPAAPPSTSPPESLGEVARRYRREKALREAETAATKNAPSPLRVELPGTALAAPGRSIAPLRVPPSAAAPALVAPSSAGSRRAPVPARVSPFQPRPSPASPVSPKPRGNPSTLPSREFQQVQVQPGDSLWRMARQYLGDGARWQELLTFNPGLSAHPDSLAAGSTVIVPGAAKSGRAPSAPTITVQPGDTLWSLARAHLGRGSAWPRLGRANPQLSDYLHLRLGSPVHLPPP